MQQTYTEWTSRLILTVTGVSGSFTVETDFAGEVTKNHTGTVDSLKASLDSVYAADPAGLPVYYTIYSFPSDETIHVEVPARMKFKAITDTQIEAYMPESSEWAIDVNTRAEISTIKQELGFVAQEEPAFEHLNWLFNNQVNTLRASKLFAQEEMARIDDLTNRMTSKTIPLIYEVNQQTDGNGSRVIFSGDAFASSIHGCFTNNTVTNRTPFVENNQFSVGSSTVYMDISSIKDDINWLTLSDAVSLSWLTGHIDSPAPNTDLFLTYVTVLLQFKDSAGIGTTKEARALFHYRTFLHDGELVAGVQLVFYAGSDINYDPSPNTLSEVRVHLPMPVLSWYMNV